MKLTVFQSQKGDCLLLEGKDQKRVLIDGGMPSSYTQFCGPVLDGLRKKKKKLDVVYVSHIDEDHIAGVLKMVDDLIEWRVYDHQVATGNPKAKQPDAARTPRPPEFPQIWHNAFHVEVGDNKGEIEAMLAATRTILSGLEDPQLRSRLNGRLKLDRNDLEEHAELATSVRQALQLSSKIRTKELGITLNEPAKGKLMFLRKNVPAAISVGGMKFFILGPREADLKKLRKDWNEWLEANRPAVEKIQRDAAKDEDRLTSDVNNVIGPMLDQAVALAKHLARTLPADQQAQPQGLDARSNGRSTLGNRNGVTPPNLASLMFLVEEGTKTCLLTGDGFADDIVDGLKQHGKLDANGGIHVNVLKVQHHGANANMTHAFARAVTADHYVFCGNGQHTNPELKVVDALAEARLPGPKRSSSPAAAKKFTMWFNCSSAVKDGKAVTAHMKKLEKRVAELKKASNGQMDAFFLKDGSFEIKV